MQPHRTFAPAAEGTGSGGGGGTSFTTATSTRYAADLTTRNIAADPNRAYFMLVNQSVVDLYLKLGAGVDTTPGAESASIVLPGGVNAGYEIWNYHGAISFLYANNTDVATGYALATVGTPAD